MVPLKEPLFSAPTLAGTPFTNPPLKIGPTEPKFEDDPLAVAPPLAVTVLEPVVRPTAAEVPAVGAATAAPVLWVAVPVVAATAAPVFCSTACDSVPVRPMAWVATPPVLGAPAAAPLVLMPTPDCAPKPMALPPPTPAAAPAAVPVEEPFEVDAAKLGPPAAVPDCVEVLVAAPIAACVLVPLPLIVEYDAAKPVTLELTAVCPNAAKAARAAIAMRVFFIWKSP